MFEFRFQILSKTCTAPETSPVFTVLLLEPFLEAQMYMNSVFLIFILVSLMQTANWLGPLINGFLMVLVINLSKLLCIWLLIIILLLYFSSCFFHGFQFITRFVLLITTYIMLFSYNYFVVYWSPSYYSLIYFFGAFVLLELCI